MSTEQRKPRSGAGIPVLVDGGQGQDRTVDLPLLKRKVKCQAIVAFGGGQHSTGLR